MIARGSYRTGDPLNTAKLREAYGAKRAAQIETQVEQDATQAETADAFLDQLDRSDLIPPGVKEALSHVVYYPRGVPHIRRAPLLPVAGSDEAMKLLKRSARQS